MSSRKGKQEAATSKALVPVQKKKSILKRTQTKPKPKAKAKAAASKKKGEKKTKNTKQVIPAHLTESEWNALRAIRKEKSQKQKQKQMTLSLAKNLLKVGKQGYRPCMKGTDKPFKSPAQFVAEYALQPMAQGTFGSGAQDTFQTMCRAQQKYTNPLYERRKKKGPAPPLASSILNSVSKRNNKYLGYQNKRKGSNSSYYVTEPDDEDDYSSGMCGFGNYTNFF